MIDLSHVKHIHCIGIGGIGLSAVAEILINEGFTVSGSDMKESEITDKLIQNGATVYLGHRDKNITGADLLVYSSAVHENNPELAAARDQGIPAVTRAQLLGHLMEQKECGIAVAGAHGKTTTTSMISLVLMNAGYDPTILVGGNLSEISGNVRVGGSGYFITEACEYMDSFLSLAPKYAVILNIDSDHLDYFNDINHITRSFNEFVNRVPKDGAVVAFDANPFVRSILTTLDRRVITFGFSAENDYSATEIDWSKKGFPSFCIMHKGETLCCIELKIPGEHNISNALAAFACCHDIGVPAEKIAETLRAFTGTQRRFDYLGTSSSGFRVVDDYAHHPEEIRATIKAALKIPHNKLWVLFQPHTYTRTLALHDDFADALSLSDKVVLAEIYAAREKNIHQLTSKTIAAKINADHPGKDAFYFKEFEDIATFVLNNAEDGDLVITMGAGDIYRVGEMILGADQEADGLIRGPRVR
jgi:UDP-N-acetylmuramate--alanine ligase